VLLRGSRASTIARLKASIPRQEPGGEDEAVVGQGGGGGAVRRAGAAERGRDVHASRPDDDDGSLGTPGCIQRSIIVAFAE
jgi:hypothetical protein